MSIDADHAAAMEPFSQEGWIADVLYEVKSGKEATVFCARGGPRAPVPLVAVKVYRPLERRGFRNDARYVGGRLHLARAGRLERAVRRGTAFGRQVQYGTWIAEEWETLRVLHEAGAAVPRPLALGERAIVMPFLGDETGPAPLLHETAPGRDVVTRLVDDLLREVELMLHHDCVHGDLSPYNVMLHEGRAVIIDFPQAVDPRLNPHGFALLTRDVERVCRWADKHGVRRPANAIALRLWERFVEGELG